jgi:hypothetical protein
VDEQRSDCVFAALQERSPLILKKRSQMVPCTGRGLLCRELFSQLRMQASIRPELHTSGGLLKAPNQTLPPLRRDFNLIHAQ